jgi:hypothetical protein
MVAPVDKKGHPLGYGGSGSCLQANTRDKIKNGSDLE